MATIRTLFSSILGFIIENVSSDKTKKKTTRRKKAPTANNNIGFKVEDAPPTEGATNRKGREQKQAEWEAVYERGVREFEEHPKSKMELRILVVGHVLLFIVIALIIGAFIGVEQNNQSLVMMRNTAFSCVGFLISATKSNSNAG